MSLTIISALTGGIFAASNPINLKLRKYDYEYDNVDEGTGEQGHDGKVIIYDSTGAPVEDYFQVGQFIRVMGGVIDGTYEVLLVSPSQQMNSIFIDLLYDPSMASDSGYIINTEEFELPHVETEIYKDNELIGTLYNSPDLDGYITINFASIVKTLLSKENMNTYQGINILDTNLSSYFKYRYLEHWQGSEDITPAPEWTAFSNNIYVVNAAMQLGNLGGGNLSYYSIGQLNDDKSTTEAKFLTKFVHPKLFKDYPFDVSFLWWTYISQPEIVVLAKENEYTFNYQTGAGSSQNLEEALGYGLHRYMVRTPSLLNGIGKICKWIMLYFYYWLDVIPVEIINRLFIDYDDNCYDNPIYLCWLNTLGGFDYWLFHTYYEDNIDIIDTIRIVRHISDYESDVTQKDVLRKKPEPFYLVGADGLTNQQIEGLKNLAYSPKVMMLINRDEWVLGRDDSPPVTPIWHTVIVKDMTFKVIKSKDDRGSVEFEIELPTINIQ